MCIAAFVWQAHSHYPLILLQNRDEYHNRPTEPAAWWDDCDILGGRDGVAGGAWLGCSRAGKVAFLTNVLDLDAAPKGKSRGEVPVAEYKESEGVCRGTGERGSLIQSKFKKGDIPINVIVDKLKKDRTTADESRLPGILPVEWELNLSSIFVEMDTPLGRYDTRSSIALTVKANREVYFHESYFEDETWKEQTVTFCIQKLK